jgi:hypothetical protein
MEKVMKKTGLFFALILSAFIPGEGCGGGDGWTPLFDGRTLNGWKVSENQDSFRVQDGAIVCNGPRSHLFYVGDDGDAEFRNFDFEAEVKTTPGSNSGIYFHTSFQETGWPAKGYEAQVFNAGRKEKPSGERKLTGSLYGIRNVWKTPVTNDEWFNYRILVQGKTIRIWINSEMVVDYTEYPKPPEFSGMGERILSSGTFALQAHDPESTVYYRNLKVRRFPDDLPSLGKPAPDPELNRRFAELSRGNLPLMDLHVHLKGELTMERALEHSREYGITYGFAVNCGQDNAVADEATLEEFLKEYEKPPQTYLAMQAEGREWLDLFSTESIAEFDYVFTDAMTWTNDRGKRMRLWIKEEVEIEDPEHFMEMLVSRIETILDNEPIDIYVNPTFLPEEIADMYEVLWTEERMDRVVQALARNQIALEINDRYKLPSATFIKRAKAAGVKFTFGTNNGGAGDLGHLEYCLDMVEKCGLDPNDMWIP